jgi:hypothetical protein
MRTKLPSRFAGVGLLLLLASGCASGSPEYVGTPLQGSVSERDVRVDAALPGVLVFPDASVDDLWRVLPATFQALGIPAGILDAQNRVYGNERVTESRVADKPLRDLFRCGSGSGLTRTQYRIQFAITAQPHPSGGGGAELRLQTAATGRAVTASASGTTQCVSNGTLEMRFQEQVEAELRRIRG